MSRFTGPLGQKLGQGASSARRIVFPEVEIASQAPKQDPKLLDLIANLDQATLNQKPSLDKKFSFRNQKPSAEKGEGHVYRTFHVLPRVPVSSAPFKPSKSLQKVEYLTETEVSTMDLAAQVPRLKHGLDKVVSSPGVHLVRDLRTKKNLMTPYLSNIHHPSEIDFTRVPGFVTTSQDQTLHQKAVDNGAKFKGSTSSITPSLSQIYLSISGHKSANVDCLGPDYFGRSHNWTKSTIKPVAFFLRQNEGIYSIDSDPGNAPSNNGLLIDLGKSLERMLTMTQPDFEQKMLKKNTFEGRLEQECFFFMKKGDFMLRSQLDCYDEKISGDRKTFDIKTRAITPIRIGSEDPLKRNELSRLDSIAGSFLSFEREYYDLMRSAMLKYNFQVRIGHMNGVLVAYHNTAEIFGFEYLSIEEMNRSIFGSCELGNAMYEYSFSILQKIVGTLTPRFAGETIRVTLYANRALNVLEVFAEVMKKGSASQKASFDSFNTNNYGFSSVPQDFQFSCSNPVFLYTVRTAPIINGTLAYSTRVSLHPNDQFDLFFDIRDETETFSREELLTRYRIRTQISVLYTNYAS